MGSERDTGPQPGDTLLAWAAALIDPARAPLPGEPGATAAVPALVGLLRRHKVPLLSLAGPAVERIRALGPAWDVALAAEQRAWAAAHDELARVQAALAGDGVQGLLIKAVGCPPSFPYLSDNLDLLVRAGEAARVRPRLFALGYVELRNVEEPRKVLFRRFVAGESVGTVHLHECVGWGTGFMDEESLWRGARQAPDDPSLLIPAPGDALLITLAHAFYEDKRFGLGDLQRVLWCLRREAVDWEGVERVSRKRGWYAGYLSAAALLARMEEALYGESSWPPTVLRAAAADLPPWGRRGLAPLLSQAGPHWRVPFAYSKRHYFHKVLADRALPAREKAADALRHSLAGIKRKLRTRSQRPFLVALHGVDGSGKTAHAEALVGACHIADLRARRAWSRLASSALSAWLLACARRLSPADVINSGQAGPLAGPQERLAARRRQLRSPWLRAGFVWLTCLDLWLGYVRQVAWPLWRGEIVVADRYVLDAAAELGQILGHPTPGRLAAVRLLRWLSPRPHMSYLLEVPADLAAGRSATAEAPELLAEQAALRRALADEWGIAVVDNSQPFAVVSERLAGEVLRRYYSRFWTLRNALFLSNPARRLF